MDAPTAAVIGAGIGASVTLISTLLTTFLAGWRQERTERQKHLWAVEDAKSAKLDDALTQMTIKLATALHSMCWVTWLAAEGPARFTEERADGYDREMHLLLPEISSWSSIIAALDIEAFRKIRALVNEVYELDVRIGTACLKLKDAREGALNQLATLLPECQQKEQGLAPAVAKIRPRSNILTEAAGISLGDRSSALGRLTAS